MKDPKRSFACCNYHIIGALKFVASSKKVNDPFQMKVIKLYKHQGFRCKCQCFATWYFEVD